MRTEDRPLEGGGTEAPQLGWLAAILDLMPTPLLLIEPGTAHVTFANRAADRLAGGEFPRGRPAAEFHCTDEAGNRIPADEMPGIRAARGERIEGLTLDWHTEQGVRPLLISADTIPPIFDHAETVVMCFEDVTELDEARTDAMEALALLDALFDSAPTGLAFLDRELRYVRINEKLAEINGVPVARHLGRTVPDVLPELDPAIVAVLREVVESGEPVVDVEYSGEMPGEPGVLRHFQGSFYPVRDAGGAIAGLGVLVADISDRRSAEAERERLLAAEQQARRRAEEAERHASFLAEAGSVLSESLDYEETLRRMAAIAVPERADWCAVDLLGAYGVIERVAVAHADPDKAEFGWELNRRYPPSIDDPEGLPRVLRTGEPLLYREIPDELVVSSARDEEHLRMIRSLGGLKSAMVVPLSLRGRVFGAISFVTAESDLRYDEEDLALAEEVARRAAIAVENARLYRSRTDIARTLQESLLPPHLPAIPGLELAARYRAAGEAIEVGGDFYDVFATGEDEWALVIGDVCGKGADAAALTALMRYTLRAAAMDVDSPSRILGVLNEAILRQRSDNRFCTAVFARAKVGADGVRLVAASGGHPLPYVVRADGQAAPVGTSGTLLGVLPEVSHSDDEALLRPGDSLVLYTDGLVEAGAPERIMSADALAQLAASCAGLPADQAARRIEEHAVSLQEGAARDDLALLVARVPD